MLSDRRAGAGESPKDTAVLPRCSSSRVRPALLVGLPPFVSVVFGSVSEPLEQPSARTATQPKAKGRIRGIIGVLAIALQSAVWVHCSHCSSRRLRTNSSPAGSRSRRAGTQANKPNGYLLGSYRIATAPEPNSSRLTSLKSICFDSPGKNVGPWPASLGCTTNSYSSINPSSANASGSFTPPTNSPLPGSCLSC